MTLGSSRCKISRAYLIQTLHVCHSRIERLLTLPPPPAPIDNTKDQPTSDLPYEIQGLLLVSIAGLRTVGQNEFKRSEGERKTVSASSHTGIR